MSAHLPKQPEAPPSYWIGLLTAVGVMLIAAWSIPGAVSSVLAWIEGGAA